MLRRPEVHPFSDKQIALLQTFADQAVIAIGNVRLFEEVQAKTRDLTEALTYQTGSANILKVIASSPTDVRPVLKAIVESACELCEAYDAIVSLRTATICASARITARYRALEANCADQPGLGRRARGRRQEAGARARRAVGRRRRISEGQRTSRATGYRTILVCPCCAKDESIGAIMLRRTEVNPFSDKQIALLQTFADQAVIAIGNVRLFEEVQAKTRDLTESLEQQTATSDVLEVISSSPGELDPFSRPWSRMQRELCEANFGTCPEDGGSFQQYCAL